MKNIVFFRTQNKFFIRPLKIPLALETTQQEVVRQPHSQPPVAGLQAHIVRALSKTDRMSDKPSTALFFGASKLICVSCTASTLDHPDHHFLLALKEMNKYMNCSSS